MAKRTQYRGGLAPNKYLSKEQIRKLQEYLSAKLTLASLCGDSRRAAVNKAIVDVLLNTGLRAAELCELQMRDMPHCHGKLIVDVRRGKGAVRRSVEVSSALSDRISVFVKRYRKSSKPRSPLFVNEAGGPLGYQSLYSKLRIIETHAKVGNLHPHKLRHTYGVRFYNRTKDLRMLQDQLGHKDPATTAIYSRTDNDERRRLAECFDL